MKSRKKLPKQRRELFFDPVTGRVMLSVKTLKPGEKKKPARPGGLLV